MKLTKSAIDRMTYGKQGNAQDIRWDDELHGFGVRIYPSGKKSFVLFYRHNGRQHIMTVGKYGRLTVTEARKLARRHLVAVERDEADPLEERKRARKRKGETVADLCADYIERHAKPHKKTWREDERRLTRHVVPKWGRRKASEIKRADVAGLHSNIGKTSGPYEANRVIEIVRKAFNLAEIWGYVDEGAANPVRKIQRFTETKRDRWVTPEELPKIAQAIDSEKNFYARQAIWLYLLTGLRKRELLRVKWSDIDWERKEVAIPENKPDRKHYLPLSEPALAILRNLPRLACGECGECREGREDDCTNKHPYVIVGKKKGAHLVNINKPWGRIRKEAGVEDVTIHDLRRTLGSWLAQSGNTLHLIGRVLNQTTPSTTAVYARFKQDHVSQALEDHGQRINAIARGEKAEVTKLAKGGR